MTTIVAIVLVSSFLTAAVGTGLVRRYVIARQILDMPNARSSHRSPTPRGGGLAIVGAFLGGIVVLTLLGAVPFRQATAIGGAGVLVAGIGFLDDRRPLPARWRLAAHFVAATWGLYWLGGFPSVQIGSAIMDLGLAGDALAVVGLVWLLNLYNFMDGIDGIASVEALLVSAGGSVLHLLIGHSSAGWILPGVLGAAVLGFLLWNFPPAKIFMGDAGSGFLGLVLGLLAVIGAQRSPDLMWSWLILLGAFVTDATVTLLRRIGRGERISEAHRSHAYQHAARLFGSHRTITLATGSITMFWLLPWSILTALSVLDGALAAAISYAPLVALVLRFRAGHPGEIAASSAEVV